jgi:hypothetical protein
MTWGWQKEIDTIAHSQISNMTGIDRRNIFRVLEGLADRRIVAISRDGSKAPTYRINKNLAEWRLPSLHMAGRKNPRRRLAAVTAHGGVPSLQTAELPSLHMAELPSQETRSEEIRKENKESQRKAALRADIDFISKVKNSDPEEARRLKELSIFRNKMFKSGNFSDDEITSFIDKSLEQLREIDTARFLERNPHLAASNENHRNESAAAVES